MLADLRYGVRQLVRSPGFAAVSIAALAIGIGANTAIFSVINTLLIRPLPYADADRLAMVWEHNLVRNRPGNVVGPANFLHWRDMQRSFERLEAVSPRFTITLTDGEPEIVATQAVTEGFIPLLGVAPGRGRSFTASEVQPGSGVLIISDRLWRRRFGSAPDILERTVSVNGAPQRVVGVMPEGFRFLDGTVDAWVPLPLPESARIPRGRSISVVGRLKAGVTPAAAHEDMVRVHAELTRMFPDFNTGWTAQVVPLREQLIGDVRPALLVLLGAVGLVLLIACANVANLLLARASDRQREFAVRSALGASRGRIVRQLLAESTLLAVAGGVAGLLLAWWSLGILRAAIADRLPVQRLDAVQIDGWVLAFAAGVSLLSALLFGVVPALTASASRLAGTLKIGGRTSAGAASRRTRNTFVVIEVALALVLLVGSGLLLRSFAALIRVDPGFNPESTVTMRIGLSGAAYAEEQARVSFLDRLMSRVEALPGVEAAGAVSFLPLTGLAAATGYTVVGEPPPAAGEAPVTEVRVAGGDYFEVMRIPLLRGRLFNEQDPLDTSGRIVISETMAERHWPGQDPIGKRVAISWGENREDEIIGVVGDVRHAGLDVAPRAMIYWPYPRLPYNGMTLTIRGSRDPQALVPAVIAAIRGIDPALAATNVSTMEAVVSDSVAERRVLMLLLAALAAAALVLAAVGIYGVIAYSVTQRTQEIGIRMALGARATDVRRMIVRGALMLVAWGVAAGAVAAYALTGALSSMLYDTTRTDPLTFGLVVAALGLVAVVASYLPARRATRVDPAIALRGD